MFAYGGCVCAYVLSVCCVLMVVAEIEEDVAGSGRVLCDED